MGRACISTRISIWTVICVAICFLLGVVKWLKDSESQSYPDHQLELLFLHFFHLKLIENQPCVFLPVDITTVHIVTNEHYEMHKLTQKQGNKSKTKTVLPFPPFLYSGTGSITPLHCPVSQSPLCFFMHFSPTPQTHTSNVDFPIKCVWFFSGLKWPDPKSICSLFKIQLPLRSVSPLPSSPRQSGPTGVLVCPGGAGGRERLFGSPYNEIQVKNIILSSFPSF